MTKTAYIILTCEKYLKTRVSWQLQTCFKYMNKKDCYYLSCKSTRQKYDNITISIYGWNTSDDYRSCPDKYIAFFKNLNIDYDWYVFIDDDTFVFPNRIYKLLSSFNEKQYIYIGNILTHLREMRYMSGGAGFIISKPTYLLMKDFINNSCISYIQKKYYEQLYGDVSFGIWVKLVNERLLTEKKELVQLCNSNYLHPTTHNNANQLQTSASFHYVTTKEQFEFYNKYNEVQIFSRYIYIINFFGRIFSLLLQKLFNIFIYKSRSLNNSQ
jgi:hypothetical protein